MKRVLVLGILAASFLFCPKFLWAEVYTIDFNRGTVNGTNIANGILPGTNPWLYCKSGGDFVALHDNINKCFYNDKGCGIRIGSNQEARFILKLGEDQEVYVWKIVIYASNVSGNSTSMLTIKCGNAYTGTISNSELPVYSTSFPASADYMLPEMIVNSSFKNLSITVPKAGCVMLHRIDIVFSEDALSLPAQSAGINYATFSSSKATFFPDDATVSRVSVCNGQLNVINLESQVGFGTSGCYVPANTGVLVASTSSSPNYYVLDGETLAALEGNMLKPASEEMTGDYKFYKLAYDDYPNQTGLGFYWGAENGGAFSCKTGTAYLAVPGGGCVNVKGFVLDHSSDEDAINPPLATSSKREDTYNVIGQRVTASYQGIYIKGGKKYVGKFNL